MSRDSGKWNMKETDRPRRNNQTLRKYRHDNVYFLKSGRRNKVSYGITFQSAVGTKGSKPRHDESYGLLTLLGPQSRFGDKLLGTKLVCP